MALNTHLSIETSLCGRVTKQSNNYAEVLLHTTRTMCADTEGLVHGGFIFSAADYAAMASVNHPNVVLGSATSKFIAPVKVGDAVVCKATLTSVQNKKRLVTVQAFVLDKLVFEGTFIAFVLDKHILG